MPETEEKELTEVEKEAREKVGDGKLPNRYFVSICNDGYVYLSQEGVWEGIADLNLFEGKGGTIKAFDTYQEARAFVDDDLSLGTKYDDIMVNCITIEDRFTGQLFERTYWFSPADATIEAMDTEDTGYTREAMGKLGAKFE